MVERNAHQDCSFCRPTRSSRRAAIHQARLLGRVSVDCSSSPARRSSRLSSRACNDPIVVSSSVRAFQATKRPIEPEGRYSNAAPWTCAGDTELQTLETNDDADGEGGVTVAELSTLLEPKGVLMSALEFLRGGLLVHRTAWNRCTLTGTQSPRHSRAWNICQYLSDLDRLRGHVDASDGQDRRRHPVRRPAADRTGPRGGGARA
jgi:hypothetical protein